MRPVLSNEEVAKTIVFYLLLALERSGVGITYEMRDELHEIVSTFADNDACLADRKAQ